MTPADRIEALRAGRPHALVTVRDLWAGADVRELVAAQANGATVGEEFAATRELRRRRERARRAER